MTQPLEKVRVYLATTRGPVAVERIAREPAPRSAMCLRRTTRVLPVSAGYDAFVRAPSGVIEREFGPDEAGAFRLDVADEIGDGESWQLGVFVAHALWTDGRLAGPDEPATRALWLTGTVDNDLNVGPVAGLAAKFDASRALFEDLAAQGVGLDIFVPSGNVEAAKTAAPDEDVRAIGRTSEVLEHLGIASPTGRGAAGAASPVSGARPRRTLVAALSVLVVAVALAGAAALWRPGVPPQPAARMAVPEISIAGVFAPDGATCQAVLFGRIEPRLARLDVEAGGGTVRSPDLCGLAFRARAVAPTFVAMALRMVEGRFVAPAAPPPELSGTLAFAGEREWRVDLPVRQTGAIEYELTVQASAAALSRGGAAPVETLRLRHRIEPQGKKALK